MNAARCPVCGKLFRAPSPDHDPLKHHLGEDGGCPWPSVLRRTRRLRAAAAGLIVGALVVLAYALICHGSGTPASGYPTPDPISPAIRMDLNHGRP